MSRTGPFPIQRAPGFLGAFLLALVLIGLPACERKHGTPDWPDGLAFAPATTGTPPPAPDPVRAANEPAPFRFVAYNLQNWLTMPRGTAAGVVPAPKPESSKRAAIALLASARPDVVGLCEIGSRDDLAEIQRRLKEAGAHLPYAHFTGGVDATRHLGLLSRHPIVATATPRALEYRLGDRNLGMQRGILDATVRINATLVRFLGVHLKSKRPVEEADHSAMRLHEAHLLRRHVDSILEDAPSARLVVYGDFNDTKASATLKVVQGSVNHPRFLTAAPLADRQGHAWTHAWQAEDLYSRYDWILTSEALRARLDGAASGILDDPAWRDASDHRPVMAAFK
jgi:endonuclease/exonuclease/phosphatase family metal-dependent hydrolase